MIDQTKYAVLAILLPLAMPLGCADACTDDGLGQSACENDGADTDGTDSATNGATNGGPPIPVTATQASDSAEGTDTSASDGESASASASASASDSDDASATSPGDDESSSGVAEDTETAGHGAWCRDADGDGFGDPSTCAEAPKGASWVDNADDCDDTHAHTYPGAAENEADPTACMRDADDDGYGSDAPPAGVDVGTDCDDNNAFAFPGAAVNEAADACTVDQDNDGWGDANPPGDADPGADCFPMDASLNPDTLTLATVTNILLGLDDAVARVNPNTGALDLMAPLDALLAGFVATATVVEPGGRVVVNDGGSQRLYTLDYELVCLGILSLGDVDPLPQAHGRADLCGLARDAQGRLVGVDASTNEVVILSSETGAVVDSHALNDAGTPVDVAACGLAFDCQHGEVLVADGVSGIIYGVDPDTGALTERAQTGLSWMAGGLSYDPVTRRAQLAANAGLYEVGIDGSNDLEWKGWLDYGLLGAPIPVSTLEQVPRCDP